MEKPVQFESDALKLYGILGRPDDGLPAMGVVLVHGWSGYRVGPHRIMVHMARRLHDEGIVTLRFDLRGRGDSEGESEETDLDGMIADTCRAAEVLRERTQVEQIALLGICSGANAALGAATLMPQIRPLALWSVLPFAPQKSRTAAIKRTGSFARQYGGKLFRLSTWKKVFRGRVNFGMIRRVLFGHHFQTEEQRNKKDSSRGIMTAWESYKGRALFIHGSKDPEAAGARELYRAFCEEHGIPSEFHLIEGANHSYYSLEWEREVIEKSVAFIRTGQHA